ncbi:class I SAM-dependent methyltransferase [Dickeya oryzae]|uniref:class I SAM-dependent methyltransferase n=1 Tax=Dickeya oryzae TaxID=1240404 RepID=UPI0020984D2C|nr:class I SAM-dependent methyltransferase [Dickeya oryzae]MCO7253981.1 class I SAM-dependent methyltransferase [Dickeya oryzae]
MNDNFYRAFEDQFRGSRELIKKRLEIYLPFVLKFSEIDHSKYFIDIGCGRGEWLEILRDHGINAKGVDLDDGMLEACISSGLDVRVGDALEYLKSFADSSCAVVSAFHVAEHLSFDSLMELVHEAFRVLMPGGLLILETPNPENIEVACCNFYLDPSHYKPIPPKLLEFLPKHVGFGRVKVVRLNESYHLNENNIVALGDVLKHSSPDFSIIAQKKADKDIIELFDYQFQKEIGLSIDQLVKEFDSAMLFDRENIQKILLQEERIEELNVRVNNISKQLIDIYSSSSWRVTAPLRFTKKCFVKIISLIKKKIKKIISRLISLAMKYQFLKKILKFFIKKFPVAAKLAIIVRQYHIDGLNNFGDKKTKKYSSVDSRASTIYSDMKRMINNRGKNENRN